MIISEKRTESLPARWYVKSTRDIATGVIKVHPVGHCPRRMESYRRSNRNGLIEACQVFLYKVDAMKVYDDEMAVAAMTELSPEERSAVIGNAIRTLREEYRIPVEGIAYLTGLNAASLKAYKGALRNGPPVTAAKLKRLLEALEGVKKELRAMIPEGPATGNGRKGRCGRPDIWKEALRAKQQLKGEANHETENQR